MFDGNYLTNNQWNRWQDGRCKSMGGYRVLTKVLPQVSRGMNIFDSGAVVWMSTGMQSFLYLTQFNANAQIISTTDVTPVGFPSDPNNLWQFDYLYDVSSSTVRVIAHAAPNLADISSTVAQPVWYGDATGMIQLTTTGSSVSGGVVVLQPYLFTFGTSGTVNWSVANKPNDFANTGSGTARIAAMKIVAALPLRAGAGNAPAGIFWALDSLIIATFVGGTPIFNFSTYSNAASILSSQSVIEYDGTYYWAGVDRFMSFNGVVREVPNDMNLNWFYDNLNFTQRQKVFAFKIPRYGEIWWCYPRGNATECTHAVILNLREHRPDGMPVWYDTQLPNSGRTCAHESQVFAWPLVAGLDADPVTGLFPVWQHEYGTDAINGQTVSAVLKYHTTPELSLIAPPGGSGGLDASTIVDAMEPDILQTGPMTIQMIGRANARAPDQMGTPQSIIASTDSVGVSAENQLTFFPITERNQRLARWTFESNVAGGSYFMGKTIIHVGQADGRRRS